MPNVNLVVLCGNLTRDWEIRYSQSGVAIGQCGMAINKKWKDASGEMREKVCFVDLVAFKKTAEVLAEHTRKGSCIHVVGELDFDQWEDKQTGAKRSKHKVTVQSFQFMDRAPAQGGEQQPPPPAARPSAPPQRPATTQAARPAQQARPAAAPPPPEENNLGIPDEEIPF